MKNKNKELQYKLEEKEVEKELSRSKTEYVNFSDYEEEFDLRKMMNEVKDKNKSEDINIDYQGMQGVKDKNKELEQRMNMLSEKKSETLRENKVLDAIFFLYKKFED